MHSQVWIKLNGKNIRNKVNLKWCRLSLVLLQQYLLWELFEIRSLLHPKLSPSSMNVSRISKFLPKSENSLEKKISKYSRSCIFVWVSTLLSKKQNSVSSTIIWLQCSFCDNLCKIFDTKYSLSILATVLCSTITALERGRRQRNDLILPAPKISYVHIWCRSVPCGR